MAEGADSDYYFEAALVNAGGDITLNGFPVFPKSERGGSETVSAWCTSMLINGENTVRIRFEPTSDENEISKLDFRIISHPHGIPRNPPENEETIVSRKFDTHESVTGPVVFTPLPEQLRHYMAAPGKLTVTRSDPPPALSLSFQMETGPGQHPLENVLVRLTGSFFEHVVYGPYSISPGPGEQVISLGSENIVRGRKWLLPDPEKPDPQFDRVMIQCDAPDGVTTKITSLKLGGTAFQTADFQPFERRHWEWANPRGFINIPKWTALRSLMHDLRAGRGLQPRPKCSPHRTTVADGVANPVRQIKKYPTKAISGYDRAGRGCKPRTADKKISH